jgi:hypothetical protein
MAQTIKHRRGKLERIASITPISGELIIASGSDLSVHQSGLLFVGVDGNVLTPSNKILTGSATAPDVTGGSFDHSVDGIPYYETDAKKLTILGKGGNTDVTLAHGQIDFNGSGIVSSSSQVSELAGINDSTLTITAGDGLKTGGTFTSNQSGDSSVTLDIDVSDFAGAGLEDDGSENLRIAAGGVTNAMLDGSIANAKLSNSAITIAGTSTSLGGSITLATITNGSGIQSGSITNADLAGSIADSKLNTISTANKVSLSALDIDGASALGGAPAGADLIPIDDGAGGTNKSMTVSNLQTYMQSNLSFSSGDIEGVTAGSGITGGGTSGTVVVGVDSGSLAGSGLAAPAGGAINVNVDDSSIEIDSDTLQVKASGITNAMLNGSIANGKLANSAITIAGTSTSLGGSITLATITNGSGIQSGSITNDDLAGSISNDKLAGSIANGKLANSAITIAGTSTSLGGSITADTIAGQISAGTITNAQLDGSIANSKLANDGITIGSTDTSLGDTITAIVGLTDLDLAAGDRTIFDTVGANTLTIGASSTDIVLPGNLTVSGTTTYIDTTNVAIGDNILELNAAGSNDGGIYVRDAEGTSNSGSLLWNTGDDRWIGGVKGSEKILTFYNADPTTNNVQKVNSSNLLVDSAISDNGTAVTISSNLIISGLTASQLVVTNGSKQLVSSTDISSLTLTLDGGTF